MKIRKPLFAAAMSCALALAMSSAIADTTIATGDANSADTAALFGSVALSANQATAGDASLHGMTVATLGTDALAKLSGNAGINIASGALNVQTNLIALATTPQASVRTKQSTAATAHLSGSSIASLGAGALQGAAGNFGINVASGVGNAQINAMIVH